MPEAGQKFRGSDYRSLLSPGVYVFMHKGLPLYIGMSNCLLRRIGGWHKQAERAIKECDEVLLYPCVSKKAAAELEVLLIGHLKPRYNKQKKMYVTRLLGLSRA